MNLVTDLMNVNPVLCTSDMRVAEIKYLLKKYDYDEMIVVDSLIGKSPIGLVSLSDMDNDDIEEAEMPSDVSALECMRKIPSVVLNTSTLDECLNIMRDSRVERIPVVDFNGHLEGIIEKDSITKCFL